jgi:hypothetical protein
MKTSIIILLVVIVLLTVYLFTAIKREGLDTAAPTVIPIVERAVQIVSSNSPTLASPVTSSTPSSVVTQQSAAAVSQIKQMIQANSSAISSAFDPSTGRLKEEAILPIKNGINMMLTNMQTNLTSSNMNQLLDQIIDLATTLKNQLPASK